MKKLKLLIVFAVILAVGGVYATWIYAGNELTPVTGNVTGTVTTKEEVEKGTLSVTNTLQITFDQKDAEYHAKISVEGSLVITYTKGTAADAPNSVNLQYSIASNNATWDDVDVLTLTGDYTDVELGSVTSGSSVTITAEQIQALLSVGDFALETASEYDQFKAYIEALTNGLLTITVSEDVAG